MMSSIRGLLQWCHRKEGPPLWHHHQGGYQWLCSKSAPEGCHHKGAADNDLTKDGNYWIIKSLPHYFFYWELVHTFITPKGDNYWFTELIFRGYGGVESPVMKSVSVEQLQEMCIVTNGEIKVLFLTTVRLFIWKRFDTNVKSQMKGNNHIA